MDNLYFRARPWITAAVASGSVACAAILGFAGKPQAAWVVTLAGTVAVFALNVDRFKNFAFGWTGLKAEMNSVIAHAAATMDQLRALATSTARASLTQSMAGLLGPRTMQISERLRLDLKVMDELRRLEVSDAQMREARELWDRGVGVLFGRQLHSLMEIETFVRHRADLSPLDHTRYVGDRPIHRARAELMGAIDFENWYAPPAQDLRDLCARAEGIIPGADELLAAYESFERTRALDRPELLDSPN